MQQHVTLPPPRCRRRRRRSVKALADALLATDSPLHCLVNNAGVLAPGPYEVTADGLEE